MTATTAPTGAMVAAADPGSGIAETPGAAAPRSASAGTSGRAGRHSASAATATAGRDANTRAALVKDLGTRFEQESVEIVADLLAYLDDAAPEADRLRALLATGRMHSPLFTLRGGTNEVLRGVVARGLGVR